MATGFEVDAQALRTLSRDLEQALQSMATARGQLSAASNGQTGDGSLDHACGEFQDKWGYGLQQLEKTAGAFVEGLNQTVKAYQTVEDEIQKTFGGGHGTLSPIDHRPRMQPGPVHAPVQVQDPRMQPGPVYGPTPVQGPPIEPGPVPGPTPVPGPIGEPGPIYRPEPIGAPPINQPVGSIPTPILRTEPTPEPVGYIPPPTIHFGPTPEPTPQPGGASQ